MAAAFGPDYAQADPLIKLSANPKFGDYQANAAMGLAKKLGENPRQVAQKILDHLDVDELAEKVDIAGPGFINVHLKTTYLAQQVQALASDERLGVAIEADKAKTVVVDYSGPNVAKEMHVGHLRSTIIGDTLSRVLAFAGHRVIRQNHLGDWGTQFGMLIENLLDAGVDASAQISDLEDFYRNAKQRFDAEEGFADRARKRVVALQGGDEPTLEQWRLLIAESKRHFNQAYETLGVILTDDDVRAESFYNEFLPSVVEDLKQAGLLVESQGAQVVFPDGFKNHEDEPQAMIVQKSDGGYLYATTDLAAARYRIEQLKADRVVYVTDARQAQHFGMVFQTLRDAGWAPPTVELDYVPFGMVLGPNRKPFKTRTGGTVKLIDLIHEAQERAGAVIREKNPDLSDDEQKNIASVVGIGALKYADLSSDRIKDYVFDWDRMLALEGNTAPYLQNAYVRIQSIFRKGEVDVASLDGVDVQVVEPAEKTLALKLLQFAGVVDAVALSLHPHRLCTYLYELASAYHGFYEKCPVLTAADEATRQSRLALSHVTARTLQQGLNLLGIDVVSRM